MNWHWLGLAVYVLGVVVTARIAYGQALREDGDRVTAGERMAFALVGMFWPLLAALGLVALIAMLPTVGVKGRFRHRERLRQRAEAAERESAKRAARIAELERDLEIGGTT